MITEEEKMKTTRDPYILGLESADRLYKGEKLSRTPKRGTTHNSFQAGTKEHQDWEEGFNFHYFTNIYTTQKGNTYFFCYDQGYTRTESDQYMLVHKQDYVK